MEENWAPERVRRNFRIDVFAGICAGACFGIIVAFLPVVVRRMGGSTFEVSLIVASPFFGHLLSPLFAYLLTGRPPHRVVATSAGLSRAVFLVAMLAAATPFMVALTSVTFWVLNLSTVAAYTTLMQGMYPDRERAQAMGKVRIGAALATIAAASLAGTVIDVLPAQWVFVAAALIGIPGGLAFFAIRYDGPAVLSARRPAAEIARDVWADRRYRRLLISQVVFGFGNLMNVAIYPILLVDHFDAPNTFIGIMAALQAAAQVLSYLAWGRRIDRGSSLRLTATNTALGLFVPAFYLLAPGVWLLLPVAILVGVSIAGSDLTFHTTIVELAPRGRVGEYAAAQSFLLGVRGTIAPFVSAALLAVWDPRAAMVLALGFMAAGTVLQLRVARDSDRAVVELAPG